jgi:hypothetical protein
MKILIVNKQSLVVHTCALHGGKNGYRKEIMEKMYGNSQSFFPFVNKRGLRVDL